ncbi:MAG: hypothetical protein SF182_01720 [Deltaproteobacteria bacterium]|nr:hypothetical protein [Deltaproteobacteria bacterium]
MSDKSKETATGADDGVLAKCGSCQAEQPAKHKCCVECGETMAKAAQAEYDAALGALGAFHKGQVALPDNPEVKAGDHAAADELLIKARSTAGVEELETAMAEHLIKSQGAISDLIMATLVEARAGRRDLGVLAEVMAKAITTGLRAHRDEYLGAIAALTARVDTWEGTPGRSRTAQIDPLAKTLHTPTGADPKDDSLRGEPLVKAITDAGIDRKLSEQDVTEGGSYARRNLSLKAISEQFPALGARISAALSPVH